MTVTDTTPAAADAERPVVLDPIEDAIADFAAGRAIVVVDDEDRENEGDIIFAAELATPELLAFMIRYTSGVVCVPMEGPDLDRLDLPLMTARNEESLRTAYTVTVDAREGVSTGISAADRAHTIRLLASAGSRPTDFVRPGHILPLRARPGGVLARRGHTEASVDFARLAGLRPAGVLAEVVEDDGTMARLPRLREFADEHGLKLVSVEQLAAYRLALGESLTEEEAHPPLVTRLVETRMPNRYGQWRAVGFKGTADGAEHVALVMGDLGDGTDVLVRLHSECLTGDAFGSHRCDCGPQLDAAMADIAREGRGVLVYLGGHEGRGIGLLHKLRAYALQDEGMDTVDANLRLGLPADAREFGAGAQILADLGVSSVRLLSNNPEKAQGLERHGVRVKERVLMPAFLTADNAAYLRTKRDRMGHDLSGVTD
ncbi:bifunctional 3,4-dihydroxy-2-butanone-4-phosphate synthase/GTP cyclohydrolase II [Nocardiopsis changdeensis]|uniref:Riboflavin biosynthesis protein RibBA n=1 Tax=Nocardiopsis changdeensis TaxID=2831969 RepID=A0ABX8BLK8_9ACTN|nr:MULTISPECIES: bifunctional 3,4-dihydroxy-2-butanone-4-phosphate synthase/GTP cyclohydrolase II [Nocardiopsis]QUX21308.1 bifunctional 3,4-dihydroxy-2-butanone-4-phosphate synthase/GTP cyclohydrolase II [Nocardiopsis changdeensis]QYX37239.1 bifunctional 3,4-dihydroxy-2-butanone-4-phosphate synthase/GTP cyclohydrolase II [Nocardiopsis sp. MT53]